MRPFGSQKEGLKGLSRDQLPNVLSLVIDRGHLAIPLIAIVYLLVSGYTPMRAALWAIGLTIVASMLRASTRISFRDILEGLENGARSARAFLFCVSYKSHFNIPHCLNRYLLSLQEGG